MWDLFFFSYGEQSLRVERRTVGSDQGFFLSGRAETVGLTASDNRVFVNGVLWVLRSGAHWHDLPEGSVQSFSHFR